MSQYRTLAEMIDHSILHPTFTDEDLDRECAIALQYGVASVCVKPYMVKQAAKLLKGSPVKVGCVIGFPHGNSTVEVKMFETRQAISDGAVEIDMVINIGKALQEDWNYVRDEIRNITEVSHQNGAIVKVIFENDFIAKNSTIITLCRICTEVGADYVKTSSGYGFVKQPNGDYNYKGATMDHLRLMCENVGSNVKVKAAGGIRTLDDLLAVHALGVSRCGATATVAMLEEAKRRAL